MLPASGVISTQRRRASTQDFSPATAAYPSRSRLPRANVSTQARVSRSLYQREEFVARGLVFAEAAEHRAGDGAGVLFFDAAHHHAEMLSLAQHTDAARGNGVGDGGSERLGHAFLYLQPGPGHIYHTRDCSQAHLSVLRPL